MGRRLRELELHAAELDLADDLAKFRDEFLPDPSDALVAYFDGNSLGRPRKATAELVEDFIGRAWAGRLIRGWSEAWLDWPTALGDRLGGVALGAAPGQTLVADSTTVLLYKVVSAALDARPTRSTIVVDRDNFPTDRYVIEALAAQRNLSVRWIETDPALGIQPDEVAAVVDGDTAVVLFSHVAYRSAWIADVARITEIAHQVGALAVWDLCHSAGVVEIELDSWGVDFAVGCSYKYLNGGPGAPAFGYVAEALQVDLSQPIWGWMGCDEPFAMSTPFTPARGIRRLLSGTPPVFAMVPLLATVELLEAVGLPAVRSKSVALTEFLLRSSDELLADLGVSVASPRESSRRGGHVTLQRSDFQEVVDQLWQVGVLPDFRPPDGLRVGLAPLSTSFSEVLAGVRLLREVLLQRGEASS